MNKRPERGDILDNFTPEQAEFVAALIATMPGCKLTVRRSRRRPQSLKGLGAEDWYSFVDSERVPGLEEHYWHSPAQISRAKGRRYKFNADLSTAMKAIYSADPIDAMIHVDNPLLRIAAVLRKK